jgi:hypothetical protein
MMMYLFTDKPRYVCFQSLQVSVNTVANIYTILLYVTPKILNSVAC